jgi:hypothetical protein
MLDLMSLNGGNVGLMGLWQDFLVADRLDRNVVVVLVDLPVNDLLSLLVVGSLDVLPYNGWVNDFVDRRVGLTISSQEGGDGLLGLARGVTVADVVSAGLSIELHLVLGRAKLGVLISKEYGFKELG